MHRSSNMVSVAHCLKVTVFHIIFLFLLRYYNKFTIFSYFLCEKIPIYLVVRYYILFGILISIHYYHLPQMLLQSTQSNRLPMLKYNNAIIKRNLTENHGDRYKSGPRPNVTIV